VALLIFAHSYFFGAYISPDSTGYLRAAQSLRNGYGFRMDAAAGDPSGYFSIWPIGYPAMIALVSVITNTEIYLASKILSIVILLIIFLMLYTRFKKNAWLYAFVAINFGFLNIFYHTWSEQPFILGLIWISFTAIDILESERVQYSHYISICLASLFLFLSRYIGAFSIGVIGILAIYHLIIGISKKTTENIKKAVLLFTTAVIVTGFVILYLFFNHKYNGFVTGMARVPISEDPFVLFLKLCNAQIREMINVFGGFFVMSYSIVFIVYMTCAVVVFRFLNMKRGSFYKYIPIPAFSFLSIGLLYWLSIVAMRFLSQFDGFSFRLLFPASALFILGIINIIENYHSELIEKITFGFRRYFLAVVIVSSLFVPLVRPLYYAVFKPDQNTGYQKMRSGVIEELQGIPAHSLIITHWVGAKEGYTYFIRPDLLVRYNRLQNSDDVFSIMIEPSKEIYLYFDWHLISDDIKNDMNSRYNGILDFEKKVVRIK
jgi:hypothetical protein